MTVCVAVKVYDCIVLGADSAVTISGERGIVNVWQHGNKVFHLHKRLPIAAMTAGLGSFGPASVSQLAKDLRIDLSRTVDKGGLDENTYTIQEVVKRANDFFFDSYSKFISPPNKRHRFQLWIGGYGAAGFQGEMWECGIQEGAPMNPRCVIAPEDTAEVIWGGQHKALNRLLLGIDPSTFRQAFSEFDVTDDFLDFLQRKIVGVSETRLVDPAMPVQDAINLVEYLVNVAKMYSLFEPGANVVGGDTDIATVTKHERFKWIRRKHYYPAELNIGGLDHVHNTR